MSFGFLDELLYCFWGETGVWRLRREGGEEDLFGKGEGNLFGRGV